MHIRLIIDPTRVWGWQAKLVAALVTDGHRVDLALADEAARRPLPGAYALLESLERIIARGPALIYASHISLDALGAPVASGDDAPDLTLDISGCEAPAPGALALRYDDGGEHDAMLALCGGRAPFLSLGRADTGEATTVFPAIEKPQALSRALEHVFSRAFTLCRVAPRLAAGAIPAAAGADIPRPPRGGGSFALSAAMLAAQAIAQRLNRLVVKGPRWRTGYRMNAAQDRVIETGRWPAASYATLPDDGQRFYADPFPVWRDGVCHLFVEEYPFATGKGVLSAATLDADGRASATRIVLERPYHLSYPMIFERDGAIWMIPETSNARTIELYRADPFPDRWVFARTLVEDLRASDMTLLEHGGKLWLLGTLAEDGGSTWDGLCAFSADSLMGEWRPHPMNPLLIDASCARPAGMMIRTRQGLVRPVQDCRGRYGAALALARIDRLDEEGFGQTVIARLPPDPRWSAVGAHTLNESGGVEAVDWIA